jgi:hypothetical protein
VKHIHSIKGYVGRTIFFGDIIQKLFLMNEEMMIKLFEISELKSFINYIVNNDEKQRIKIILERKEREKLEEKERKRSEEEEKKKGKKKRK